MRKILSVALEFNGISGKRIYIASDKIAAFTEHKSSTEENPKTSIFLCMGNETEEWLVNETLDVVRYRFDNA